MISWTVLVLTPWLFCEPVLIARINGDPIPPAFVLYRDPVYLDVQSSCYVAVRWWIRCDMDRARVYPSYGIATEDSHRLELRSLVQSPGHIQVACRLVWAPCQQADLTRDCLVDRIDLLMLRVAEAPNTLEMFSWMQNEWSSEVRLPDPETEAHELGAP